MVNQVSLTKLCAKIIGAVIMTFSLMYIPNRKFGFMLFLMLLALAMAIPTLLLVKETNAKFLARYLITGANVTVFVTQCISGHYEPSVPLFICIGALSALYFEPGLVSFSFLSGGILFIIEYAILSLRAGQLIAEIIVLAELLIAMFVSYMLIVSTVKSGCHYYQESTVQQQETTQLLAELDSKNLHTEQVLGNQEKLLTEIEQVADRVAQEADDLSRQSETLASGAMEQANSMEQLTGTVNEICGQIRETADYAQQIREGSETMNRHVETGGERMEELLRAIGEIEVQMQSIEVIIKSIDDIAFQTNILALNAAVESARAGAAGKGFAVVADEVRRLAGNSAEATENTILVLSDCRNAVKHGVSIADETAAALAVIQNSVTGVKQQAFRISDMSSAQLTHFDSVNEELSRVSSVVQSTAGAAQKSADTVQELSEQVRQLRALNMAG